MPARYTTAYLANQNLPLCINPYTTKQSSYCILFCLCMWSLLRILIINKTIHERPAAVLLRPYGILLCGSGMGHYQQLDQACSLLSTSSDVIPSSSPSSSIKPQDANPAAPVVPPKGSTLRLSASFSSRDGSDNKACAKGHQLLTIDTGSLSRQCLWLLVVQVRTCQAKRRDKEGVMGLAGPQTICVSSNHLCLLCHALMEAQMLI